MGAGQLSADHSEERCVDPVPSGVIDVKASDFGSCLRSNDSCQKITCIQAPTHRADNRDHEADNRDHGSLISFALVV